MPNDKKTKPCKDRIDQHANKAKTELDKIIQANPNLALELKPVKDSLEKIASDPHH